MAPVLVLSANTPWVYSLAQCLADHTPVTAVRFYDWKTYLRMRPRWPESVSPNRRMMVALPPGYAGRLEPIFRPLVRGILAREEARLRKLSAGAAPLVICPYPYLVPWVRNIPANRLVYYNLDEYPFYEPSRKQRILRLEGELIAHAGMTICLSMQQVKVLRARNPAHATKIHHFPLGVAEGFLNPEPDARPLPGTVGYVGNLADRMDWGLIAAVAERMPNTKFHIVGRLAGGSTDSRDKSWQDQRRRTLGLANVIYEGEVPQGRVHEHYWRYAVNWMPYDTKHGFNIASCPTKIMDALASGRPFVSTDIPEVRLYPGRIHVASTPEAAVATLGSILLGEICHDFREQVNFAASQTWPHRARQFIELIGNMHPDGPRSFDEPSPTFRTASAPSS